MRKYGQVVTIMLTIKPSPHTKILHNLKSSYTHQ